MLSIAEKSKIMEMIHNWRLFKTRRTRKKFDNGPENGWLTMLMRENMLEKALIYLEKVIDA